MPKLLHQAPVLFGDGEEQILHNRGVKTAGGRAGGDNALYVEEDDCAVLYRDHVIEKCAAFGRSVSSFSKERLSIRHSCLVGVEDGGFCIYKRKMP